MSFFMSLLWTNTEESFTISDSSKHTKPSFHITLWTTVSLVSRFSQPLSYAHNVGCTLLMSYFHYCEDELLKMVCCVCLCNDDKLSIFFFFPPPCLFPSLRLCQVSEMAVSELPGNPNAVWTVRRHVEGKNILVPGCVWLIKVIKHTESKKSLWNIFLLC